jgi:hypothetical protein
MSNFTGIREVGAALIDVDRRTDMRKPIVAFHEYEDAPEIVPVLTKGA